MLPHSGCARPSTSRQGYDLAEIFRAHGAAFRAAHRLSLQQARVMRAIEACRTPALGTHLEVCLDCGAERPGYNSCRNRHCPKCQAIDQHRWLEKRCSRTLPTHYFHVVFTLPREMATLARRNPCRIYGLLFRAAARSLLALGEDPQWLGAQLGLTLVLHTWTRELRYHPHIHAIVTGGGLTRDGTRWIPSGEKLLFPVKVLGKLYRGKFLHGLRQIRKDLLRPADLASEAALDALIRSLYEKDWVVYAKRPYAGPRQVFSYLGRYTHRIALSNRRLLEVTDERVVLATRHGQATTLTPQELIRRFLLHVLPSGFVKIRHYGLMASANVHGRLEIARRRLEGYPQDTASESAPSGEPATLDDQQRRDSSSCSFFRGCSQCGSPRIRYVYLAPALVPPSTTSRAPP